MWFMPVYVRVVFLCQLALCLMNWYAAGKSISPIRLYGLFAGVLLSVYLSINAELPMTGQLTLFPWADPTDVFFLLCWMAGLFIGLRGLAHPFVENTGDSYAGMRPRAGT